MVDADWQAVADQAGQSTGTVARVRLRTGQNLQEQYGTDAPELPAQRTFYRLVERIAAGTPSARPAPGSRWRNAPADPVTPAVAMTPNEQYAALIEAAGYVPVPLGVADYIELLPVTWWMMSAYGIKISHRCYDSRALNPCRCLHSGVTARKGLWETHYDPTTCRASDPQPP